MSQPTGSGARRRIREGSTPLPDPDPRLSRLEEQGKVVFERACAQCHGGPNQSSAEAPVPQYQDIGTQCPRPVDTAMPARFAFTPCPDRLARNVRTYEITVDGSPQRRSSDDPGRALLTGFVGPRAPVDDWHKFDVPQLRGMQQGPPRTSTTTAPPRWKRWSTTTSRSSRVWRFSRRLADRRLRPRLRTA